MSVPLVRVAEVLGDGRILARELHRSLELLDGVTVVAALEVDPAEAVDVEAVVGLDLQRATDQPLRLVELHAHLGVGVAEVIQGRRVLRVDLDRAGHLLDGAGLVLRLVVGGAEREAIAVVLREVLDHALEERDRGLDLLPLAVERGEVAHQVRVVGLHLEGAHDLPNGLGYLLRLLQEVRALDPRVDVVLRVGRDLAELRERPLHLLPLAVHGAEVVADAPVLRLRGQHQVELRRRALRIALLEIDEADLRARLARIRVELLHLAELRERIVELLLPDVEPAEPPPYEHALRVERQDALVELDRLVGAALELVGEPEIREDQLGLRVQLQRFQIVVLGLVELARRRVDPAEIVVAENGARVPGRQLLQGGDGPVRVALLAVERTQVQVGVLALGIERQDALVSTDRVVVAPERRQNAGSQAERLQIVGLALDRDVHLLERPIELPAADVKARQPKTQERRDGIGRHRSLEGGQRRVDVVLGERDLAPEEVPEGGGVVRHGHGGAEVRFIAEPGEAAPPESRAPGGQQRDDQKSGRAGAGHQTRAPTMAKEYGQRKPRQVDERQGAAPRSARPHTTRSDDGQSATSRSERRPKTFGSSCQPSPTPSTVRSCAAASAITVSTGDCDSITRMAGTPGGM